MADDITYNPIREKGLHKFKTTQGIEGEYMSNLCVHCQKPIGLNVGEVVLVQGRAVEISCSPCAYKKRRNVDSSDVARVREKMTFDRVLAKILANKKLTPEEAELLRSKKMKVPESFIESGPNPAKGAKSDPDWPVDDEEAVEVEKTKKMEPDPNVEVSKELDKMADLGLATLSGEKSPEEGPPCPF